jgi:transposase
MTTRDAARAWGVSIATAKAWIHIYMRDGKLKVLGLDTTRTHGTARQGRPPRLFHAADIERLRLERMAHPPSCVRRKRGEMR